LWGGDQGKLVKSIQKRLFGLPGDALVVTGHGPLTTLDSERRHNPYVGADA
jgi:hydroxyacylglutathione hydrolase